MTDKPARYITHLTQKLAASQPTIERLERELAGEPARIKAAVATALARSTAEHERGSAVQSAHSAQLNSDLVGLSSRYEALAIRAAGLEHTLTSQREQLERDAVTIDELRQQAASLGAREAALESRDTALKALVARVEDRMRERERQEASAILNRRAVATAVPGIRHR